MAGMKTYEAVMVIIQELNGDMEEIHRLRSHNSRAWDRIEAGADDILDYGALAFTIHTIYGVLENYFLRISKFFENSLPQESWHKTLVERMALDIPGVRPALITDTALKNSILELLRFRHKFRNLYGEDLRPEKIREVQENLTTVLEQFPAIHRAYTQKIKQIADTL